VRSPEHQLERGGQPSLERLPGVEDDGQRAGDADGVGLALVQSGERFEGVPQFDDVRAEAFVTGRCLVGCALLPCLAGECACWLWLAGAHLRIRSTPAVMPRMATTLPVIGGEPVQTGIMLIEPNADGYVARIYDMPPTGTRRIEDMRPRLVGQYDHQGTLIGEGLWAVVHEVPGVTDETLQPPDA
jgi:hypothetical protein